MKKLGVIQIIDSLNTGGAEVLAVNIANALVEKNVNSHICATRIEGSLKEIIHKNVGYIFLSKKNIIDLKALIKFKKYLKNNLITTIHAHSSSYFFAFCVKLLYPKVKIIYHIHQGKIINSNWLKLLILKIVTLFFHAIITVNASLNRWASNQFSCKNIYFLNNFPVFNNNEKITILKGNINKRIIHLAGFREEKDHTTLITAFNVFTKNNKDWSLHLIGPIQNNLYSQNVLDLIKTFGLENCIFTYGSCLDISNILNQSTIGILSSKSEGLPISLLEYGLAKLPVIVTDVGECAKVVTNDFSGFVVSASNHDELSKKLNILANSSSLREEFSEKLYQNIIHNYSRDRFIKKIINIYTN